MYKKILVTLDGSPLAESALPHAQAVARQFEADLILLRVFTDADLMSWGFDRRENQAYLESLREKALAEAMQYLDEKAAAFTESGLRVRRLVEQGQVVDSVLRVADEEAVDLIVMATHGWSGVSRWVYGSVADRVLRSASHALLLIRATESTD